MQVNHAGARDILARAGAAVTDAQVRFGREMAEAAIASSPPEFTVTSGCGTQHIGGRHTQFLPAGGPALRDGQRSRQADGDLGGLPQLRPPLPGLRRDSHDGALGRAPGHCAQTTSPPDDAVSDARFGQADLHLLARRRPGRGRLRDPAPALRPGRGRVPGAASYLHCHQHQLTAHPGRADVPGAHRFRRRGTDVHHHPLHALGRDGAGHDSRRTRPAARRDARGPGADPDRAPRGAGGLRRFHLERGHEVGVPGIRYARVRAGLLGHRPACAPGRPPLALLRLLRFQHPGCPVDLGDADGALGRAHRRGQHRHPRGGVAGRGA